MGKVSMTGGSNQNINTQALADAAAAKAAKAALDAAKKAAATLAASNKKQQKAAADALKLKKAGTIFDLSQIQIVAALKGNISEEERTRLKLMLAIEQENVDKVDELTKKLKEIQDRNIALAAALASIPSVGNPFEEAQDGINGLIDSTRVFTAEETAAAFALADSYVVAMANVNDFATMASNAAAAITAKAEADSVAATAALAAAIAGAEAFAALMKPEYYNGSSANRPEYYNGSSANNTTINITVNGAIDPIGTANAINQVLQDGAGNTSPYIGIGSGAKDGNYRK